MTVGPQVEGRGVSISGRDRHERRYGVGEGTVALVKGPGGEQTGACGGCGLKWAKGGLRFE